MSNWQAVEVIPDCPECKKKDERVELMEANTFPVAALIDALEYHAGSFALALYHCPACHAWISFPARPTKEDPDENG